MEYKHTLINTQTDFIVIDFDINDYRFYIARHMLNNEQQLIFDDYINNVKNYNNIIIKNIPLDYNCKFTIYDKDFDSHGIENEYDEKLLSEFTKEEIDSFNAFIDLCNSFKSI
jgi:hypothetical protein